MSGDENEKAIGTIILIGLALLAGPALLARLGVAVAAWGLEHDVLVPAGSAFLVIPGIDAGLDIPRVGILALVVIAVATLAGLVSRSRKEATS